MTRAKVEAANKAMFAVTAIAYALKALSSTEEPVDPCVALWLGTCLVEAGETLEPVIAAAGIGGAA